jgi:hypothetical protein
MFPYALLPPHKGVKQDTIGVTKWVNVKQPHYKGFVLIYLVENENVTCTSCRKSDRDLVV